MYLGYQNGKVKFYTKEMLDSSFYQLDKQEYTDKEYVLDGEEYVLKDEAWEEKQVQAEAERVAKLYLTGADVERGIYQAKGMDFEDIIAYVSENPPEGLDIKALKIELKANNFYRGNPYVDVVGSLLEFTSEQLDKFFDTKDYHWLMTCTLTVNATPVEATVTGAGTYPYGSSVDVTVECEGYASYATTAILTEDMVLDVELEKVDEAENERVEIDKSENLL